MALLIPLLGFAQDIKFTVSVDKTQIAMNDQFTMILTVSGTDQNLPSPRVAELPNFAVAGQSTSQNMSITNGKVQSSRETRVVLLPQKMGTFRLGPFQIVHNGKKYTSSSVNVKIVKAGTPVSNTAKKGRGDLFIDVIVDKKDAFLHEQVTVTYYLYFRINVTGLDYKQLPTTTGFWAEELDIPKDRSGNFTVEQKTINGERYNRVMVRKMALFPTTIGELEIGPMKLNAKARATRGNDPFGSIFGRSVDKPVNSAPVKISVGDLPVQGRPAEFDGAVGKYNIAAKIDKTTLPANDAATLTLTLSGTGSMQAITEPKLNLPPDFKAYDPQVDQSISKSSGVIRGSKTYEYVLIPRYEGEYTIDPIRLSYFDPQKGQYQTVSTQPISIVATESLTDEPQFVMSAGGKESVKLLNRDIRFIKFVSGSIRDKGKPVYRSPVYVGSMGFSIFLVGLTFAYRKRRDRLETDEGYARKLQASRHAKKLFSNATKALKSGNREGFYSAVTHALTSFIADKWNLPPAAVTADTAETVLSERGVTAETIQQVVNCLNTCNFARFAPATEQAQDEMKQMLNDAQHCVTSLDKHR